MDWVRWWSSSWEDTSLLEAENARLHQRLEACLASPDRQALSRA